MEYVGDNVSVIASFGGGKTFRPLKFRWAGRVVEVKEVTYRWTGLQGDSKVYHFSVTDGTTLFELSFDSASMLWTLEKVEPLI